MSLLQEAQAMEQEIIGWRRYFHENPELGLELPKTAAKVQEELEKMGVRFRPCGQSGVLGYIGKEGGKSITPAAMTPMPPCCWVQPNC